MNQVSVVSVQPVQARILDAAQAHLFSRGYNSLTMDELARELGISKKTIYSHFSSKDSLAEEVIRRFVAGMRNFAESLFAENQSGFLDKLQRFVEGMSRRFGSINPHVFAELKRNAPQIHLLIEEMRRTNIPLIFNRILSEGQKTGMVRKDLDARFAIEFWRSAIQSLMQPESLERLGMRPEEVFRNGIRLFFGGLLTPTGRKEYEKRSL